MARPLEMTPPGLLIKRIMSLFSNESKYKRRFTIFSADSSSMAPQRNKRRSLAKYSSAVLRKSGVLVSFSFSQSFFSIKKLRRGKLYASNLEKSTYFWEMNNAGSPLIAGIISQTNLVQAESELGGVIHSRLLLCPVLEIRYDLFQNVKDWPLLAGRV